MSSKEEKPRRRKEFKTEYKKKFRPFSQYDYVEGKFQKKKEAEPEVVALPPLFSDLPQGDSWYREVLELRKKAGEYKHRGWGTELVPQHIAELYNKQMTLWEQVSRRSSLSALSLASTTPRSISKEEKEKENNKKSSPTKPASSRPHTARQAVVHEKLAEAEKKKSDKPEDSKRDSTRSRKEYLIRHHLERTTGAADGALLTSPTREKLEPALPRQKEEDLPKSPQKASPKSSPRSVRSQSMGPGVSENRSPKRQVRTPASAAPPQNKGQQLNGPVHTERRPRPTSLATTAPSRPKSSSSSVPLSHHTYTKAKPLPGKSVNGVQAAKVRGDRTKIGNKQEPIAGIDDEKQDERGSEDSLDSQAGCSKHDLPDVEPAVVKSPPEPTRVKSPEQILMRSPEPVNWTVPLDTGKTFTVTQNVHEAMPNVKLYRGELMNRPHSEVKAWTPPAMPPPAPQSAPPELFEQVKSPQTTGWKPPVSQPETETETGINGQEIKLPEEQKPPIEALPLESSQTPHYETSVAGTTLRCLEDPLFTTESNQEATGVGDSPEYRVQGPYRVLEAPAPPEESPTKPLPLVSPSSGRSIASDVLEKARTRFDKFWGKGKDSGDKEGNV